MQKLKKLNSKSRSTSSWLLQEDINDVSKTTELNQDIKSNKKVAAKTSTSSSKVAIKYSDYEPNCRYHSCFNPCRSSDKFGIYLYPLYSELTYSNEFLQIYHTILHSEFYEKNPEQACMQGR